MSKTIVGRSDAPHDFTPSPRDDHGDFNIFRITDDFRSVYRPGSTHEYELRLFTGPRPGLNNNDMAQGVYPINSLDHFECIANRMVEWAKHERARLIANTFEIPQPNYADKPESRENLEDFFKAVIHAIASNKGTDWAYAINKSCGVEWTVLPNGMPDPEYPSGESYWSKIYHDCEKGDLPPPKVVEAMKRLLTKYGRKWDEPFVLKINFHPVSMKGHSAYDVRRGSESWKKLVNGLLTGDTRVLADGMGGHCIDWKTPLKRGDTKWYNGWGVLHSGLSRGTTSLPDYVKEGLTNKALQFIAEGF